MDTLINVGSSIFSKQIHLESDFVYEMLWCWNTKGQWTNGRKEKPQVCKRGVLYIWSRHYTHKDKGWGLFDHQKPTIMGGYFCWLLFIFCYFLLFILLLVAFGNYFLLLKGATGVVLFCFFREGVHLYLFILIFFIVEGEGGAPLFIYFDFFYCWRGRGRDVMRDFLISCSRWV